MNQEEIMIMVNLNRKRMLDLTLHSHLISFTMFILLLRAIGKLSKTILLKKMIESHLRLLHKDQALLHISQDTDYLRSINFKKRNLQQNTLSSNNNSSKVFLNIWIEEINSKSLKSLQNIQSHSIQNMPNQFQMRININQ